MGHACVCVLVCKCVFVAVCLCSVGLFRLKTYLDLWGCHRNVHCFMYTLVVSGQENVRRGMWFEKWRGRKKKI